MADEEFQTNPILTRMDTAYLGLARDFIADRIFPLSTPEPLTPEQLRAAERRAAEARKSAQERLTTAQERHGTVMMAYPGNAAAQDVLALHQPQDCMGSIVCHGCEASGYEAEDPEYPCRTTMLLTVLAGIEFA